jgi:hypothetical protein
MDSILTSLSALEGFTRVGGRHKDRRKGQGLGCRWGSCSDLRLEMALSLRRLKAP